VLSRWALRRAYAPCLGPMAGFRYGSRMNRVLVGLMLALPLFCASCTREVALRPGKTCDGGNVEKCKEACDQNQGRACYRLGWFYEEGLGVKQNRKKAVEHYERACQAKWAVACRALGMMYWRGDEVKRNRRTGLDYYQRACDLGLAEACPTEAMIAEAEGRRKRRDAGAGVTITVDTQAEAGSK
jgi:Sel1 repeat-containing protein